MNDAAGRVPRWSFGDVAWWHYRRPGWRPGDPQTVHPVRVVEDVPDRLVAWLAGGTPILAPTLVDGRPPRAAGTGAMFTAPRVQGRMLWKGGGTLRVVRPGQRWSVWLFWDGDAFDGWYVNLEAPHRREGRHTVSTDHVLDVVVAPDRRCRLKDEDELAAAVAQGRMTADDAEAVRADADDVRRAVAAGEPPFGADDAHWATWRPDPTWPTPGLPPDLVAPAPPPVRTAPRLVRPGESRY